jgi:Leucine-rich repeat (LRR) protein
LSSNEIESIDALKSLTNIEQLFLSKNKIENVDTIQNFPKLNSIELDYNKIGSLSLSYGFKFASFADKKLILKNNELRIISKFCFASFPTVETLILTDNKIKSLENFAMTGLDSVETVDFEHNLIESVEPNAFHDLKCLNTLRFGQNLLKFVELNAMLVSLDVTHNSIQSLSPKSLVNISKLAIDYENMVSLRDYSCGYFSFDELELSNQRTSTLFKNTIKGLFRSVNLQNNLLENFEADSFGQLPNLAVLMLSKNLLKNLDFQRAFEFELSELERLDLSSNKIATMHKDFFSKTPGLVELDLIEQQSFGLDSRGRFLAASIQNRKANTQQ